MVGVTIQRLAELFAVVHLDALSWNTDWSHVDARTFACRHAAVLADVDWVIVPGRRAGGVDTGCLGRDVPVRATVPPPDRRTVAGQASRASPVDG